MSQLYDVFLSHSNADKPAVEKLALKLREAGMEPFLDKWHLVPGEPWQEALEEALDASRTCAVFLGPTGFGGWQHEEMRSTLETRVSNRSFRVIPVLLPGSFEPRKEDLPRFLRRLTWVDFRAGLDDEDAFHRLVSGIQGKAPGPGGGGGGGGEPAKRPLPYRCMAQPPDEWVHRREYDEVLEALCPKEGIRAGRSVGITTALRGAGGFGKTALAQKLCFDERVRAVYPEGILWVTMGEDLTESGRLSRIRDLIRWWTEKEASAFETVEAAGAELRRDLATSRVLVVIDDAWSSADTAPFKGLATGSALLITTRVAHALPERTILIHVDAMASSEAVSLLRLGLENEEPHSKDFNALAELLCEWALLLRLVNGTLRKYIEKDLSLAESLQRVNDDLREEGFSAFDQNDEDRRQSAASKVILVSLKRLSEKDRDLFFKLAIFPEDENIPLAVLERCWDLGRSATRQLCEQLSDLSLLRDLDQRHETIRLHDVTRRVLMELRKEDLPSLHSEFLNLMRPASGKWQDLSADKVYAWKRLGYHLIESGRVEEIRELLGTFSFLEAKLMATDVNSLISDYELLARENQELRLIRDALRLSAHILSKNRKQLAPQLLGRLLGRRAPGLNALLEEAKSQPGSTWLRPRTGGLTQPGGALIRILEGHTGGVTALAVLDGSRAVSASDDRTLRVWDLESGKTLKALEGHTDGVTAVAVLDGQCVVSGSDDGTLRVWDLESGQTLKTLDGNSDGVRVVVVLDGRRVVSGSDDGTLQVWDLESGRALKILEGHTDWVNAVAVLDGRHIVSASNDRTLRVWDLESGKTLKTLEGHRSWVTDVVVLDGQRIVSASADWTFRVWDLVSGQTLKTLKGHSDGVTRMAVLDGRRVVSASHDGTLWEWDLESGEVLKALEGHTDWVKAVAVLDGGRIVSASADQTLRVWNLESRQTFRALEEHADRVRAVAVFGDRCAISASSDGTLWVWDLESGEVLKALEGHTHWVTAVAVVDVRRAVSASVDETLRIWDLESGQTLKTLEGHTHWVTAVAVLDGRRAVSASYDRRLRVWDLESGKTLKTLEGHIGGVTAVAVLDGRLAVSASDDQTLLVWDLESGKTLKVLEGHSHVVTAVTLVDSRRAVSASDDRTLRVWDLESGQTLKTLEGHTDWVTGVAVVDGRRAVSASYDGTLRVWDLESGEGLAVMTLDAPVLAVAATSDGKIVVAGDQSGKVHFFDLLEPE